MPLPVPTTTITPVAAEQGASESPEDFVRRLFHKNTYESLSQYRASLQQQIAATDDDVRDVIGSRYKELIETCDMVVGMEDVCGAIKTAYRTQNDATSKQQQQLLDRSPNSTDMEPLWKLLLSERVVKEVGEVVARIEEKVTSLQLFLEACASHTDEHSPHQFEAAASAYRVIVGVAQRSTIIATCLHALAKEMLPQSQSGEQLSPRGARGRHKSVAVDAFEGLSVTISRLRGLLSHTLHHTIPNRFFASMRQQLIRAAQGTKAASSSPWSITSYIDTHVSLSIVLWTSEEAAMNTGGNNATPFQWSGSSKANPLESHGNAALSKLVELHWIGIQTFIAEKTAGGSRRLNTNTAEVVTRLTDRLSSYLEAVHSASVGKQAGTTRISTFIDKSVVEAALGSLGGSTGAINGSGGHIQRADALLEAAKGAVTVSDEDFLDMMLQYVTEDSNKAVKPSASSPSRGASNVSSPTDTSNTHFTTSSPTAVAPTLRNHFNLFADISASSTSSVAARQGSPDGGRRSADTRLTITHCVQESLCNYFSAVRALDASSTTDAIGTLGDGDPSSVRAAYPSVVLGLLRAQDVLLQRFSSAAQVAATTPSCIMVNGIFVLESLFSAQALMWFGGEKVVLDTSSNNTSIWADVKKEADLFSSYQAVLMEVILGAGRVAEGGKGKRASGSSGPPSTTLPSSITPIFKECVVNALTAMQVEHNSTSNRSAIKGGGVTKWGSWSPSPLKFHPTEEPSGNTPLRVSTDLTTGFYSTQDIAQIVGAISMSMAVPTSMGGFSQYAMEVLGSATLLASFNMNLLASSKRFQRDLGDLVCTALDHTSASSTSSAPLSIEKEAVQTEKVVKLLSVFVTAAPPTTVTASTPSLYWDNAAWSTILTTHISTLILGRVQRAVEVIGDEFDGILNYAAACYPHSPYKAHCVVASGGSSTPGGISPTPGATTPTATNSFQPSFPPTFLAPHYLTTVMPGHNNNSTASPMTNTNLILQSVMARRQAAKKQEVSHASTTSRSIAEKDTAVHSDIMLYLMSVRNLLTSLDSHLILTQLQQQQVEIMYDRTKGRLPKHAGGGGGVAGSPVTVGSPSPRREPTVERPSMSKEEEDAVLRQQLIPLYNRVCALSQKIESTFSNLIFKLLDPSAAQRSDDCDAASSARGPQLHLHTQIGEFLTALCHRIEDSVERVSKLDEDDEGSPSPDGNPTTPSPSIVVLANVAAPILHILLLQLQYAPVLDACARSKTGDLQSVRDRKQKAMDALLPFGQHIQHLYVVSYQGWISFAADKLRIGLRKGWRAGLLHKCATVTHASQRRTKALAELHKSATTSVPGKPGRIMMDMNGLAQTRFRSTLQSRLWGSENVANEGASDTTQVAFPQRPIPEASLHLLYGLMFDVVHTSTLHHALDVITPVLLGKLRSSVSGVLAEMIDEGVAATERQLVLDGRRESLSRSALSSRAVSPASSVGGEVNIDVLRDDCNMTTCEYDECFGCCEEYFVQLSFEAEYLRLCLTPTADLKYRVLSTFKPKSLSADRLIESPRGRSNSGGSDVSSATSHEVAISSRFHSALHSGSSSTSALATTTARRVAWGAANKAWVTQIRTLVQDIEEQVDVVTWALCESRVSAAASQYFESTKHLIPWCGGTQPTSPASSKDGSMQLAFRAPVPVSTTLPTIDRFQLLPVTLPVDAATAALSTPSAALQRVIAASPFILTELNSSLVESTNDSGVAGKRGYDMSVEKAVQALRGVVVAQPFDTSDEGDVTFYTSPTRDAVVAGSPAGGSQAPPSRAASQQATQHQSPFNALPSAVAAAQQVATNSATPSGATIASSLKSFWGWQ